MADSLKSLPDSCRNSCEFAIGYANPPPYLDANTYSPCQSGGWLASHLEICLRCAASLDDSTKGEAIRGYILAQAYTQLLSCGPDSWAGPYLPVTKSGDTIWSVAKTTYVKTIFTPTTISTVVRINGFASATKVELSSLPIATWATTEGFWVEFQTGVSSQSGAGATGSPPPMPSAAEDGNSNEKKTGVIVGGVIAGLVGLSILLAASWILLKRKRLVGGRKKRTGAADGEKFDGSLSEKGDSDYNYEKPRVPIEMDTEREKVEIGDGRVYHELGAWREAFELDAADTEVQDKTKPRRFGPEEKSFYLNREGEKQHELERSGADGEIGDGGASDMRKSSVAVVDIVERRSSSDDEPGIQDGMGGARSS